MTNEEIRARLAKEKPEFLEFFNCKITKVDPAEGICEMEFDITEDYCHSGNIIQGGFITAMLDSVSSHAIICTDANIVNVSTMELKVSFYAPSLAGKYRAIGKVEKQGYKTAFVSGVLISDEGVTTAVLSATAKIVRDPAAKY